MLARGGKQLFSDLSSCIQRGQVLGLCGDSGKSSLGDALLGLLAPVGGDRSAFLCPMGNLLHPPNFLQASFSRGPPKKYPPQKDGAPDSVFFTEQLCHEREEAGSLLRTVPHFASLRLLLRDLCCLHRLEATEQIPLLLRRLDLGEDLLERRPAQVSSGELQRFAILRALLLRPRLLVADEPSSRLDPITAARTLRLIVDASHEMGCTLLLISHEKPALQRLCDEVLELGEQTTVLS